MCFQWVKIPFTTRIARLTYLGSSPSWHQLEINAFAELLRTFVQSSWSNLFILEDVSVSHFAFFPAVHDAVHRLEQVLVELLSVFQQRLVVQIQVGLRADRVLNGLCQGFRLLTLEFLCAFVFYNRIQYFEAFAFFFTDVAEP